MSAADLVREVKYRAKIDRDTDLANRLGVGKANVSAWLKGTKPNGEDMLKLIILGDIEPKIALQRVQEGYASLSLLIMTALTSIALLAPFVMRQHCILC